MKGGESFFKTEAVWNAIFNYGLFLLWALLLVLFSELTGRLKA